MRAILTYHSIDPSGSPISCHPDAFAGHVAWLASGQVAVKTIDELMGSAGDGGDNDSDAVAVTFDDAYVNFDTVAAPRLLEHGLPVTVFVVSDLAGTTNSWDNGPRRTTPELPLLDWPALIRLQERGVTLGAHSRTHADVSRLDGARLEDEVGGSAERLEARTGVRPGVFAYPYGHISAASAGAVQRTFRFGCTTELRVLAPSDQPALLPRLDMYYFQQPDSLAQWGGARFRARLRARTLARRHRMAAGGAASRSGMRTS
jgi:peptidoglycan/xylan/chitin deacetylase (PgdA/CDA1 family)